MASLIRALERVQPAFFDASVSRHHKFSLKLRKTAQFVGLLTYAVRVSSTSPFRLLRVAPNDLLSQKKWVLRTNSTAG
jgi:hypothetical protein